MSLPLPNRSRPSAPKRRSPIVNFGLVIASLLSFSCSQADFTPQAAVDEGFKQDLAVLKGKRIFFGHQSVGRNVMEGLGGLLQEAGEKDFRVVDVDKDSNQAFGPSVLAHSRVGANTNPTSKCEGFAAYLADTSAHFDAAVLKFCYVDVKDTVDTDAMLETYKRTIASIREKRPGLVIVHATVPLKAGSDGFKLKVKRLIRWADEPDADNARRDEFNRKLKAAFPGDPFFDIAALESTLPGGDRQSFVRAGGTHYSLIPSLTYDGGHLNETGRRMAAKAMVHSLASALRKGEG